MNRAEHWDRVYTAKGDQDVSWFEPDPSVSMAMLEAAGLSRESAVLDVGGGNARLVDRLLAMGLTAITVLDVSGAAIARTRSRLGAAASIPTWITADVTGDWASPAVDLWHDRAVFHFLADADERERYVERMWRVVKPGGAVVMATFALEGPETCSGLRVTRYSAQTLADTLGPRFAPIESRTHDHQTPWGASQRFQYARFRRT